MTQRLDLNLGAKFFDSWFATRFLVNLLPLAVEFFVEAVVALPFILPPAALGFLRANAIGPYSPIGQAYVAIVVIRS